MPSYPHHDSSPTLSAAEALEPLLVFLESLEPPREPEPRVARLCRRWAERDPGGEDDVDERLAKLERGQSVQIERLEGLLRRLPDGDGDPRP